MPNIWVAPEKPSVIWGSRNAISFKTGKLASVTSPKMVYPPSRSVVEMCIRDRHKQFGTSSEKTDSLQLSLFNEAESHADMTIPEPKIAEVKAHYRKRTRLTTDKLPKELPIEIIEHQLSAEECICPECGSDMHTMGKEIREELKIIPAKAIITRHVQHIYACRNCEETSDHVPIVKACLLYTSRCV